MLALHDEEGKTITNIPPHGMIARVTTTQIFVGQIQGFPVFRTEFGGVVGMPDPINGTVYITSSIVAQYAGRDDVVSPNTSGKFAVRGNEGNIVGCRALQAFTPSLRLDDEEGEGKSA